MVAYKDSLPATLYVTVPFEQIVIGVVCVCEHLCVVIKHC